MQDKFVELYFSQLNSLKPEDYPTDRRRIESYGKVMDTFYDIVKNENPDFEEISTDMQNAAVSLSNASEVLAFKMGVAHGVAIAGVKS